MTKIISFKFDDKQTLEIKDSGYGYDWPAVYLIEDGKELYVGESNNVYFRSKQHLTKPNKRKLKNIHVIGDETFNKSATLDTESLLIQYMAADGKFVLQNGNKGLLNHRYYDRESYLAKFEGIWKKLKEKDLVVNDLIQLKNSDLFKYSPYKALTFDQLATAKDIINNLQNSSLNTSIVDGRPGTGKTILAVYLFKLLLDLKETKDLKIGLVVPMTALRKTLQRVFRKIKGLKSSMVIGASDVAKERYDILIVDEAHRLRQRKNITNFKTFDDNNRILGLDNSGTELDWILKNSDKQILFYDEHQSVRPTDVSKSVFDNLKNTSKKFTLKSQLRVVAGESYIDFIDDTFDVFREQKYIINDYDFKIFKSASDMVDEIKKKNKDHGLSRVLAGYAWTWKTKKDSSAHDIEIGDLKLKWNSQLTDWVNSPNSINEVGCIHTIQGYDLNYAGVIIGPEIYFCNKTNKIQIDENKYKDINGKKSIKNLDELERYIINIYKTLLTRGIKGTYVYIVDENLREYFEERLKNIEYSKDIVDTWVVDIQH
jgi:uncharacterized protein